MPLDELRFASLRSRVVMVPGAGHFPHEEDPDRFVAALKDFVRTTSPSVYDQQVWRDLLRSGGSAVSRASLDLLA